MPLVDDHAQDDRQVAAALSLLAADTLPEPFAKQNFFAPALLHRVGTTAVKLCVEEAEIAPDGRPEALDGSLVFRE